MNKAVREYYDSIKPQNHGKLLTVFVSNYIQINTIIQMNMVIIEIDMATIQINTVIIEVSSANSLRTELESKYRRRRRGFLGP